MSQGGKDQSNGSWKPGDPGDQNEDLPDILVIQSNVRRGRGRPRKSHEPCMYNYVPPYIPVYQ